MACADPVNQVCFNANDDEAEYERIQKNYDKELNNLYTDEQTDESKKAALREIERLSGQLKDLIKGLNKLPDSDPEDISRMRQVLDGMEMISEDSEWDTLRETRRVKKPRRLELYALTRDDMTWFLA